MFRRTFTGVVAVAALSVALAAPSSARPACGADTGTCTKFAPAVVPAAPSPYAVHLAALGGRSLAQYMEAHELGDPRLRNLA